MTLSFRTKLLASHVGLVLAVGVIAILSLDRWLAQDLARELDLRLEAQARGAIEWAAEGGKRHPDKVATRIAHIVAAEVTLFDKDGAVIGASSREARADLGPEVEEAKRSGIGRATRVRAGDVTYKMIAMPGSDGIVVRIAVPLSGIEETVAAMRRRLLFASSVAIAVALALGFLAARVASRPLGAMTRTATRLAEGDFDVPIEEGGADEFGVLWRAFHSLREQLKARIGELVRERDRLSAILEGMVEGVLVFDAEGRVVLANPAASRILRAKGALAGRALAEVVADPELRAILARRSETDEEIGALVVYVRPLPGDAGVAVIRDETALRRLATMRRDFVANVSHELRTPVTAIQGYAETLLRGTPDDATRTQFLEIVHRQAQRIGSLVEQLLTLSEIESRERDAIPPEPVAILPCARHVAEAVRGRADARKVTVTIDAADDAVALGDADGLERALINLVDNAIKYGKDSGTVTIRGEKKGDRVLVTVADDGPGIAAEHLPRLFERFYRVDPGRARQHGGAGLGLSIVKHLVEAMDGSIEVTSDVGRGTRFVLSLPTP